jgi:superfamily II DNA or RNA helicase
MKNPKEATATQKVFQTAEPNIFGNDLLRRPQLEAFEKLAEYEGDDREIGLVLPVGCGKSGLIAITPFAFRSKRALVVAPGVKIAKQLVEDFTPSDSNKCFYIKCKVLDGEPYPEPVPIRGNTANRADLDESDVVITNIHQLAGAENRWLEQLSEDYFDLIMFDEGHHNVAASWTILKNKFPAARIVNFSATPERADGQLMAGRIIYSFPVEEAIKEGFVKRLRAIVLNPKTLRYVRDDDGKEVTVSLDDVIRLGEDDAAFRRGIVTAPETLETIVVASINELNRIRQESGEKRHKIIACCLNYDHCIQVKEAYAKKGLRAEYIHSRESAKSDAILEKLDNHELDVIVQVRKLGEGFNHKYLSVAAVFSVFTQLSPFVQFVGRIMRVVDERSPASLNNQGTVIFHAGANIHSRWSDFQRFSAADQAYFEHLFPVHGIELGHSPEAVLDPARPSQEGDFQVPQSVKVVAQTGLTAEEIPLLERDDEAAAAFELLKSRGFTAEDFQDALLKPIASTKLQKRQAARVSLYDTVSNSSGKILGDRKINPKGRELDKRRIGKQNYAIIKGAIDKQIYNFVGRNSGERHEYSMDELEHIRANYDQLVEAAIKEVFDA